jgi:hypothetical protein
MIELVVRPGPALTWQPSLPPRDVERIVNDVLARV